MFLPLRLSLRHRLFKQPHINYSRRSIMSSVTIDLDTQAIQQEIAHQTTIFNDLRSKGLPLEDAKKRLGDLKKQLATLKGPPPAKDKEVSKDREAAKKKERLLLKTAKGTRDYGPAEMFCREYVERTVKDCFTSFGGACLDTPVFERKDILAGKYGEDAKLIFDLMDQGGEQLALRYDHTVPLARYLAMMGGTNTQSKLWQVGKVYRRDNPVMSKGRMREFSQADFDMVGEWDSMIPDAELVSVLCTVLTKLEIGDFTVKINNRKILDGIFEICGVPNDKIRTISSAVDKLDKLPWIEVKKEMTDEKGLDPVIADKIGMYVKEKGGKELLARIKSDESLTSNASARQGILEMEQLFTLLDYYNVMDKISFDLSLARGLDYYTGIIYEVVVEASAPPGFKSGNDLASSAKSVDGVNPAASIKKNKKSKSGNDDEEEVDESQVGVGSIAAGGRYDGLVGMFLAAAAGSDSKKPPPNVPCVGVSIGLDRIFALVWPKWVERGMRSKETMVYVVSIGKGLIEAKVKLVKELRDAGIKSDFLAKYDPKLNTQFGAGEKDEVPFVVLLGETELNAGLVKVKEQRWELKDGKKIKVENEDKGVDVERSKLVEWLKNTKTWQGWETGKM